MPLPDPEEFPNFRSFPKTFWTSFMLVSCWLYKSNLLASENRRETLMEDTGKTKQKKKQPSVISSVSQHPQTQFYIPISNFSPFSYATALFSTMSPFLVVTLGTIKEPNKSCLLK